ncbi:hypothetical protein Celaphus_00006016 [Cervus elaphus hippelaphus]|uniref:Uncharacterized protein n=1 Tax=Cervus elaphus hippelaphus TaxID=46360 RepID=A0A212CUX6_CEREH|nr:hypothetical protein Celaphus_00006016 [Cervus elaphus hippelaphus]
MNSEVGGNLVQEQRPGVQPARHCVHSSLVAASLHLFSMHRDGQAPQVRRQSDTWGSWGNWSPCSRTCGGGVSFRERPCYTQRRDGGSSCVGPTRSHRSCRTESCPDGARDFRAEQCAEFDSREFQGRRYKWLPYYGAPNKCELNCIPKGESFYYKHKEAVVDGTPCEPGKRDICVDGSCRVVGCDHHLDSLKQEDKCLQCGGDGTTCYPVTGVFEANDLSRVMPGRVLPLPQSSPSVPSPQFGCWTRPPSVQLFPPSETLFPKPPALLCPTWPPHLCGWALGSLRANSSLWLVVPECLCPPGYNQILIVPVGATSIRIEEAAASRNFLAVKSIHGEYYLNGHWTIEDARALPVASTLLHYERGAEGDLAPERLHARGPTSEPLVIELISQEPNPGVRFEYHLPLGAPRPGFSWSHSSWGDCSAECGGGQQTRWVFCTMDDEVYPEHLCQPQPRPADRRPCSSQPCPHTKRLMGSQLGEDQLALTARSSQCSVSCGAGVRRRSVTCRGDEGSLLHATACSLEDRPPLTEPCVRDHCRVRVPGSDV